MSGWPISRRGVLASCAGAALATSLRAQGVSASGPSIAATRAGRVIGLIEGGVHAFKGIPYGEPTGGAARFLPPRAKASWSGVYEATRFAPRSPQRGGLGGPDAPDFSEDCLALNVWTPSLEARLPVMVWLHGGGWEVGGSSDPVSNGAYLARMHGVVLVSVNHRLNVYGYLNLAQIAGERYAQSGNAGILDVVLALQWVRDNIEAFGGDPDRVLIFGQSGGGRKVSTLMAMPPAAGLFQRAVVQSGPGLSLDSAEISLDRTDRLLHRLGIAPADHAKLAEVPTATLTAAGMEVRNDTGQFRPFIDGTTIPAHPFLNGAPLVSAHVPLMIGTTRDETAIYTGTLPEGSALTDAQLLEQSQPFFPQGEAAPAIAQWQAMFPTMTNAQLFARLITDRSYFLDSTILAANKAALQRAPAYLYTVDWQTQVGDLPAVSPHGIELPFVFGNLDAYPFLTEITPAAERLRTAMAGAWSSFARDGVPRHPAIPQWLPYEPSLRATMLFGETVRLEADPYAEERQIMATFGSEQLAPREPRPPGPWLR